MFPRLALMLADASPDPMISGNWIIAMIGAIAAGVALVVGKKQGRAEAADNNVTIKQPVPTVPMSRVTTPPTWSDHKALADRVMRTESDILRVEGELKEMRITSTQEFQALMHAGADREQRIGDKIDGFARAIHSRIDEILKHPTPRSRS